MKSVRNILVSAVLEKIMPEQVESPAQYQVPPRETHDFPHLLPVTGPVAMNMAMLAGRFRIERAFDPPGKGVIEKFPTILTKVEALESQSLQFRLGNLQRRFFNRVFGAAVGSGEQGKNLEVLSLLCAQT